jgi:DNA-binding PadR family transcriptional regulator
VSSIRLFILGSLAQRGPMHGHGLILLAEEEHTDLWTDFAPSAIYGAIKRLASEGLISEERVERQGKYPERQIYRISGPGQAALDELRKRGLSDIVIKPDPVDLAITRLDPLLLDELPEIIRDRLDRLRATLDESEIHLRSITHFLTVAEVWAMRHQASRLRGEIAWHEDLLAALPEIIADEKSRKEHQ